MEQIPGDPLDKFWSDAKPASKLPIILKVFEYQKRMSNVSFTRYGSLYYTNDLDGPAEDIDLYVNEEGQPVRLPQFTVGPSVGRVWFDDGRQILTVDRGPCKLICPFGACPFSEERCQGFLLWNIREQLLYVS